MINSFPGNEMTVPELQKVSLKVKNYKSFGEDPQGFDVVMPINLIIGKNNAGKSALLDAIGYASVAQDSIMPNLYNNGKSPELIIKRELTDQEIRQTFLSSTSGGQIGGNFYDYGKRWVGKPITVSFPFTNSARSEFVDIDPPFTTEGIKNEFAEELASRIRRPFESYVVRRIAADRDIRPEGTADGYNLSPDGSGATNLIRFCLHDADANAGSFIKRDLLTALNYVFQGEAYFKDVLVKSRGNTWEVYLAEDVKRDEIALSNSGSGLKTIILVLLELLVMSPMTASHGDDHFIFMFEEIENNLHPGLLRNLLSFIRLYAKEKGCIFFITTHSSVAIDLFDKDLNAQIVHVRHDKKSTIVTATKHYLDRKGIIEDLGVRSSDLLQANAIIWVEGPSDRTYINHWISLCSEGKLREGEHYQCVFYGGRLLARVSADPDNTNEVNVLKVNANAILVMDSDILLPDDKINATKERMKHEVESVKGYVWVTDGKEIENYLPKTLLETYYQKTSSKSFGKNNKIQDFLNGIDKKLGDSFVQQKPFYAERFIELYTKDMLEADLELSAHIKSICGLLNKWNGPQEPSV